MNMLTCVWQAGGRLGLHTLEQYMDCSSCAELGFFHTKKLQTDTIGLWPLFFFMSIMGVYASEGAVLGAAALATAAYAFPEVHI